MQVQYDNMTKNFLRLFYSGLKYYKYIGLDWIEQNWNKKFCFIVEIL